MFAFSDKIGTLNLYRLALCFVFIIAAHNAAPIHGAWSNWSAWGGWTATCGVSTGQRSRTCTSPAPSNGGSTCPGVSLDTTNKHYAHSCTVMRPAPINGAWSNWSAWGGWSATCGVTTRQRSRTCTSPAPSNGGSTCPGASLDTTTKHRAHSCPVHGSWGAWEAWNTCKPVRFRSCDSPAPKHGGNPCPGTDNSIKAGSSERHCNFLELSSLTTSPDWSTRARSHVECAITCTDQRHCVSFRFRHGACFMSKAKHGFGFSLDEDSRLWSNTWP